MALVEFKERLYSADTKKRLGQPTYYGERRYSNYYFGKEQKKVTDDEYGKKYNGYTFYGDARTYEGIYQTRHYKGGKFTVQEKFYNPTPNYHATQQTWRGRFADAISAWQALTSQEKEVFRIKSSGKKMSGYNVFLHEYLITHRL